MGEKDTPHFIVRTRVENNRPILELECKQCQTSTIYDLFNMSEDIVHQCPTCGKSFHFKNELPEDRQQVKESIKQQIRNALNNK